MDITGQGDLSLIDSVAHSVAGGNTLIAWFEDACVFAGFVAPVNVG
ncbi:MAG: hypothetical protein AB7O92_32685 [Acidimicrobiia bacterium]